jgi:hypothetical protein
MSEEYKYTESLDGDMTTEDFNIHDWLDGREEYVGIPSRIDSYKPRPVKWGKCPDRARATQRPRIIKRDEANIKYFMSEVFDKIKSNLNSQQLFDISLECKSVEALRLSGFRLWKTDDGKQAWISNEDKDMESRAADLGAKIIPLAIPWK